MENEFSEFKMESFLFKDRNAKIVYPNCKPVEKLILKTEYWDAFPNFEIEMIKRGFYWCNIEHQTRWAPDEETDITAEFVKHVCDKLGISPKCIAVGMSCGGLQAARLAQLYPELVEAMYLDAPVLNILSQAGLGECECSETIWRELVATYGFSKSTLINFRKSPIDEMDVLIKHNIPVIMLYGNADTLAIYEENGKVLENYYKKHGGTIKVISKSVCGHHPHGLENPKPIIDFIEQNINMVIF